MEKTKVDINILGQDISVMCTENEKEILLKSRDRIVSEAEKVKSQTKNVGHDYFLILVLLNIAGSDIKNEIIIDDLKLVENELDQINHNINDSLK
ncbi:cell division protein ZapA [Gammaproteobacteria bacterium]|jgi:cell division protein ZapA (FtsZ GTPase activity inhibitor)|nr:cell division protein ZapA [Gammaproteobacteria bacterium]|tara:strand:- start:371 stop:655 length:285 start_codon:yes stop_codon:yes gene_type:complete